MKQQQMQKQRQERILQQRWAIERQNNQRSRARVTLQRQAQTAIRKQKTPQERQDHQPSALRQDTLGRYGLREIPRSFSVREASDQERAREVVTIDKIWAMMETSSEVWSLMMDTTPKVATVDRYINWYRQRGVIIQNPPIHYVRMIDSLSQSNPEILNNPFEDVLKLVAVIEYDFDNGQDKDSLAREVLGERFYRDNKKRLQAK